ncbi:MAG: multidrug effflux MFS transporter [Burkholderiaceae bacterium]|nr:multidrug effflux MFS transporter [Burkholderiaceae bacterium]
MHHLLLTLLLALFTMLGPLGIDTYLPSFPAIAREFSVGPLAVQQTLSVFVLALAAMMLVHGVLSDTFGRRRVMLVTVVCYGLTSLAAAFATSIEMLIFLRGLQGLTAGAGMVVSRAMVQDRYHGADAQRMTAMIMLIFGLAPALAPIFGGWLQLHGGWRASFGFLSVFSLLLFIAGWRLLPETLEPHKRHALKFGVIAHNYATALRHRRFRWMLLSIGLMASAMSVYIGSASEFIVTLLGLSATDYGWLFIPLVGGGMTGAAVSSVLASRLQPATQKRIGFVLLGCACCLNVAYNSFFTAAVPWAVVPISLYTLGLSLLNPLLILQAMGTFPQMRGLASSLQGFVHMGLFSAITGLVVPFLFHSTLALSCGHAVLVLAGMLVWYRAMRISPDEASAQKPRN